MRFPEFAWVDFAKGDVSARNNVVPLRDALAARDNGGSFNSYVTVYRFAEDYADHCRQFGSVSGYTGAAFADYLPIDVDRANDLEGAHRAALQLAATIHEVFRLREDQVRYFFSGAKGYHLLIPTALMGTVEPSRHLPTAFRTMASGIADMAAEKIDAKIYDVNRLFRLPDTQHAASRLWKIELTWHEFSTLHAEDHRELAKRPRRLKWEPHDLEPSDALSEYFAKHIVEAEQAPNRRTGASVLGEGLARNLALLLTPSYVPEQRHNLVLAFAGYAAKRHLPRETALGIVEHLASGDDEAEDRIRAVEDTYDRLRQGLQVRGYQDLAEMVPEGDLAGIREALGDLAPGQKTEVVTPRDEPSPKPTPSRASLEHVYDADRAAAAYLQYARDLVKQRVEIGIPSIDRRTRGLMPGTVTTLVAKARVGKSLFAQKVRRHVARHVPEGCTVFFSLEMPIELVWERDAQAALERSGHDIEVAMRSADDDEVSAMVTRVSRTIPRSYTVTAPALSLDDMRDYCGLVRDTFGHRIALVLIDYMSLIRGPGKDLYHATTAVARGLKSFAKELRAPVVVLSQVRRRGSEGDKIDGSTAPSLEDARDSGAIEEGSDNVIGAWRPRLDQDADDRLCLRLLKNRMGRTGEDVTCAIDWRKMDFWELLPDELPHSAAQ